MGCDSCHVPVRQHRQIPTVNRIVVCRTSADVEKQKGNDSLTEKEDEISTLNHTFFFSQAIINVRNDDQQCLKWALLSALHLAKTNPQRISQYVRYANELDFSGE